MAMQNTLSLPELLENIISHLPERDILCNAQRVSRHWEAIIDSSPTIQKKIWLQPLEQAAVSPIAMYKDNSIHLGETPVYLRTTLKNTLLISPDRPANHFSQISQDLGVIMKAVRMHGKPTGCSLLRLMLEMPTPKIYEQMKARPESGMSSVPSWRKMYLSQPPVTMAILTIAYFYQKPVEGNYHFQVMIRDKAGIILGLVYDTFAATMPAYDESLEHPRTSGSIVANAGWMELDEFGSEGKYSEDHGSEEDDSDDDSDEDGDSVTYDGDGNVMDDSGLLMEESSSEIYEYTEHESELGSDTAYEAADDEEPVKTIVAGVHITEV
jgi:hypothetical protein